jgi:hypothetical protein
MEKERVDERKRETFLVPHEGRGIEESPSHSFDAKAYLLSRKRNLIGK